MVLAKKYYHLAIKHGLLENGPVCSVIFLARNLHSETGVFPPMFDETRGYELVSGGLHEFLGQDWRPPHQDTVFAVLVGPSNEPVVPR